MIEELLTRPYWVIDFLPEQVPEGSPGQFFAVEGWYLRQPAAGGLRRRFAEILLKLNCYVDFSVCFADEDAFTVNPGPDLLSAWILESRKELCVLLPGENALITLNHDDICMTVYNPSEALLDRLKPLVFSAGLFLWQPGQNEKKPCSGFQAVAGLSHVAIRTRDIQESIRFYTGILGLREAFRMYGEDGSLATVYLFLAPGQYLELFSGGSREGVSGPDVTGFCHLCLMTKDIQQSFGAVRRTGGPLDSEIRTGNSKCLMFWTHDPDGTQIEVMEMPPESLQAQADRRLCP